MRPTQWIGLGSVCGMMVVVTASPSLAQEGEFRRRLNVYTAPDARMLATSYQGQSPEVTDAHVMVSSGAAVQFRLVGDDPDGDGLQFAIVDNPQHGVVEAFDAVTGQVTYRSNRDWVGEDLLRFVATDGHWTSDVGTVVIHVSAPDAAPYFIEPTPLEGARIDGQEGSVVRVELAAIDPDGDPVVFEANGLPTGAALDAETGVLTWFPEDWQAVGDHCMTVTAVAGRRADARSFCLRIRPIDDDNDGAPDSWERHVGLSDQHPDSDGDTLSDGTEMFDIRVGGVDTDEDGVIDALDDDSDGDGLLDRIEAGEGGPFAAPLDTDRDGIPDFRDRDSDQDGIDDADDHCPRQRAPTANGCFRQDGEGTPPPEAPNMVAPEDGAVQFEGRLRFEAGRVVDPDGEPVVLLFRIYEDPWSTEPLLSVVVPQSVRGRSTVATVDEPLQRTRSDWYTWTVTAVDAGGAVGPESEHRAFRLIGRTGMRRRR